MVKVLCYKSEGRWFAATSARGTVDVIPICDVLTKPTMRPDVTRRNGLPETIQMEDVSVAEKA